jgi:phage-related minor tail protein
MATLADLMVKLGVDADGVDAGLDAATSSFESKIGGWKGIAVAGGAVAAGALAMAFDSALDLSASQTTLQAQFGLTEQEAAVAGGAAASAYSDGFGGSLEEVTATTSAIISSIEGMSTASESEIADMTKTAQGLADTYEMDVGQAALAAGRMIETGMAGSPMEAMDLLAAGARDLPAAFRGELPDVLAEYSENFHQLGLSGEQSISMLSEAVANGAPNIDMAADALRELEIRVVNMEKPEALDALGLSATEMASAFAEGGPAAENALGQIFTALEGVDDEATKNQLGAELFGSMWEDASGDAILAMNPLGAELENLDGAATSLTDTMASDPGQQMEAGMRTLATTLGSLLLPVLTTVANFAQEHPTLFKIIAGAVLVAAVAFTVLSVALWAVNAAVLANPITWIIIAIIAGIALLIAAIVAIIVYWDEIVAAVAAAWNWIKEATAAAVDWLVQAFQKMGQWIVDKWNAMWSAVGAALSAAKAFILGVVMAIHNWIMSKVAAIVNFFVTGFNRAKSMVSAAISALRAAVLAHVAKVVSTVKSIPGKIKSAMSGAKSWLVNAGKDIIRGLINGVQNMIGSLKSKFSEITNMIPDLKGPETVDLRLLEPAGEALMIGLDRGISDGWGDVQGTLRGITGAIPGMVNTQGAAGQSRFAGPQTRVVIDFEGLSRSKLAEAVREAVRIDGGGSVDQAFSGTRG